MAKEREKDAISIGAEGRRGDEVKSDEFLLRVSLGRFAQTRKKEKKKKGSVASRRYAFDFSIESRDRIDAVRRGITMVSHGRTSLPATQKTTPLHPSNSSSSRSSWLFPTSFLHFSLSLFPAHSLLNRDIFLFRSLRPILSFPFFSVTANANIPHPLKFSQIQYPPYIIHNSWKLSCRLFT